MAITTTTITPVARKFPFTLPYPGPEFGTNEPRAELFFNVSNGAITVAAGGASQAVNIVLNLPANFVYGLAEVFVALQALTVNADLDDWQNDGYLAILDGNSSRMQAFCPLHSEGPSGGFKCYYAKSIVDRLVIGGEDASSITLFNPVIDGAAMQIEAMIRFWQFDINQRQHVGVQTPMLIRGAL